MRMQHDLLTQLSQVVLPLSKTAESSSEEGSAAYGVIKDDVESLMNGDGEVRATQPAQPNPRNPTR